MRVVGVLVVSLAAADGFAAAGPRLNGALARAAVARRPVYMKAPVPPPSLLEQVKAANLASWESFRAGGDPVRNSLDSLKTACSTAKAANLASWDKFMASDPIRTSLTSLNTVLHKAWALNCVTFAAIWKWMVSTAAAGGKAYVGAWVGPLTPGSAAVRAVTTAVAAGAAYALYELYRRNRADELYLQCRIDNAGSVACAEFDEMMEDVPEWKRNLATEPVKEAPKSNGLNPI